MFIPSSTYRIQFNNQYTFKQLLEQLRYLSSLGIGAVYASPVFAAVPGSKHGYDVTNPYVFNSEIGTAEEFDRISGFLKSKNIGWIQDIVPNHMAFHPHNAWLMDVLEKGKLSQYSGFFDIDWDHPEFRGKVMVPILGKKPEHAIADREIKMVWQNGGLFITYYDFRIPVRSESFHALIDEFKSLEGFYVGQGFTNIEYKADSAFHGFSWSNARKRYQADNSFETFINNICEEINSDTSKMRDLLSKQHFVLSYWQDVEQRLNYRRFFTINGLISLSMEKQQVFDDYHSFIFQNVKDGKFQGLRIDHVDGLKNPNTYFERLRARMGDDTYIVVEKILEHSEELQKNWPLQGSSGYDFLSIVNNLFTHQKSHKLLVDFYNTLTGNTKDAETIVYEKKKLVLLQSFRADLGNLVRLAENSGLIEYTEKISHENFREALGEFLVNCPVYKLYSYRLPLEPEDEEQVRNIIGKSVVKTPHLTAALHKLRDIFLQDYTSEPGKKGAALEFFLRCMQYTGPLMAKGVEDTAMYTSAAFIAHNEVGDAINAEGFSIPEFHQRMIDRRLHYPNSINAAATHDTKRGEDTRARLNVLSDLYLDWVKLVNVWVNHSLAWKTTINGNTVPDINEEYFIYQTIIGALPMNGKPDNSLPDRIGAYLQKALREAKINSEWNVPNEDYENAVIAFAKKLLSEKFLNTPQLQSFLNVLIAWGITNSLSQVVLKCMCPGIPDFYQGTELWDLSLVDPDNRREVNYKTRETLLESLKDSFVKNKQTFLRDLFQTREDGRIKLWMAHRLMQERFKIPQYFTQADYIPLEVTGEYQDNILAFARVKNETWYITIVPLHAALLPKQHTGDPDWQNTRIIIPENAPQSWRLLWDDSFVNGGNSLIISEILAFSNPVVLRGDF